MSDVYRSMSTLMLLRGTTPELWSEEDLGAILCHQLAVPLVFALGEDDGGDRHEAGCESSDIASFGELFRAADPPRDMLDLAKRFAKDAMNDPQRGLPREVAQVLYYLAIATAHRVGYRISTLAEVELAQGVRWSLGQRWVRGETRACLQASAKHLM